MDKEFEKWLELHGDKLKDLSPEQIAYWAWGDALRIQAAQHSAHPTYGESAPPMQWTTPEDFTPPVVRLGPPISG